jgi:hypothetical protein
MELKKGDQLLQLVKADVGFIDVTTGSQVHRAVKLRLRCTAGDGAPTMETPWFVLHMDQAENLGKLLLAQRGLGGSVPAEPSDQRH